MITEKSESASGPLHPESFPILPDRAVRALTAALLTELVAIDREGDAARKRCIQACNDAASYQELAAIVQTITQCSQDIGAIRDFLERIDPAGFAPDFPQKIQPTKPLTPEERAQLRALGTPGKETRP